jgi:hypothetical protein
MMSHIFTRDRLALGFSVYLFYFKFTSSVSPQKSGWSLTFVYHVYPIPVNPPCYSHKASLTHVSPMLNPWYPHRNPPFFNIPRGLQRLFPAQRSLGAAAGPSQGCRPRLGTEQSQRRRGAQGRKRMGFNGDKWGFTVTNQGIWMGIYSLVLKHSYGIDGLMTVDLFLGYVK